MALAILHLLGMELMVQPILQLDMGTLLGLGLGLGSGMVVGMGSVLELGMEDSSFANPNGLDHELHYSTAYDMALLARACLDNSTVAELCATKSITVGTRTFVNHNKLLWRCEGCVGMKTGFTEKAGRTLVSAATRDGQTLICVTLNAPSDWADHTALLDWGFANFMQAPLSPP